MDAEEAQTQEEAAEVEENVEAAPDAPSEQETADSRLNSDAIDVSIDEEQQMLEEENQILEEEEREKTLAMEGADGVEEMEMGPPETKEEIGEEEEPISELIEEQGAPVTNSMSEKDDLPGESEETELESPEQSTQREDDDEMKQIIPDKAGSTEFLLETPATGKEKKASARGSGKKLYFPAPSLERSVQKAIKTPAPPHEYFGFIFSAQSKRPPGYYHNYFLPLAKQPQPSQHVKVFGQIVPFEAIKPMIQIRSLSLPLSTLKVRWKLHRQRTIYKSESLYTYFTRFGEVERIIQTASNSALVVFADLKTANIVVKTPSLGFPWDDLIAEWMNPSMGNYSYYKKYEMIEASPLTAQIA